MRRFFSYGPVNKKLHYYAPRKDLIDRAYTRLVGENPDEGGHYITVWGPRQTGKSWLMQQILFRLQQDNRFDILKINLEFVKYENDTREILNTITKKISEELGKKIAGIDNRNKFQDIFKKGVLNKPLILILDEFDALAEDAIGAVVSGFRNIYNTRMDEGNKSTAEKSYLLHGVALIGIRSALGIENVKGSPFNVQRSLHIPNLKYEEVKGLFAWYEKENGQKIEADVIDRLFYETQGQPGLTCWFGELLTEGFDDYKVKKNKPVTMKDFEIVYAAATYALPNNNILNIISKARQESNKKAVLELFQTDEKIEFRFDNKTINALYMNGVVEKEVVDFTKYYLKFSSPFVQKRLFHYFSDELFSEMGTLMEPFSDLDGVITDTFLNIGGLIRLYQRYLAKNESWLFKDAPRRSDLKIFEAVFHFNLYSYINEFLRSRGGSVLPEFPTGNGKIDLVIKYKNRTYGIELKSYTDQAGYKRALKQAARYGGQMRLSEIFLVNFVSHIPEETRKKYEVDCLDDETGIKVIPIFIETGE